MVFLKNGDMMESMCEAKIYDFDQLFPYMGGALGGHQMAGSILLLWGIWQSLNIFYYYTLSRKSGKPFQAQSWYHLCNYPVEPIIKIIGPIIASIAEVTGGFKWYR
jgi:hypothetical protein